MVMSRAPRPPRRGVGFTLIELLVVIAIIAILTAIIFPVFATLRENARQKTSIANLHTIQTGLAQFKLDHGTYPPVLFGYVFPGASMDKALAVTQAQYLADQYFPGLYPEYINDVLAFTDGNNPNRDLSKTTSAPLTQNALGTPTTPGTYPLVAVSTHNNVPTNFYLADAYDISPQISGPNALVGDGNTPPAFQYVVRYQPSWTGISANDSGLYDGTTPGGKTFVNYNRQLRWTNPPADTYVTSTTYHVTNSNKVIVLWESGEAKAIDASRFLGGAAGDCTNMDPSSAYGAKFWQVSPTDPSNPGHGSNGNCQ